MDKPWLFGIGAGKTASHSLAEALAAMGLRVAHIGNRCYHGDTFVRDTMLENRVNRRPPTDGIAGLDGIIDWPVHEMFRELDKAVPDAKFILTYRPPDDCALSWCRMIAAHHKNVGPGWPKGFIEYADLVRRHNDAVMRHFFRRPEHLLVLDVRDSDETKWGLLAKFVGKAAPKTPYPRSFDHAQWQLQ